MKLLLSLCVHSKIVYCQLWPPDKLLFLRYFLLSFFFFFHKARKSLVTFAFFAKFAAFSKPYFTFTLSKPRIFLNFAFLAIFVIFITQSFYIGTKFLVTFAIWRNLGTFYGPSSALLVLIFACGRGYMYIQCNNFQKFSWNVHSI